MNEGRMDSDPVPQVEAITPRRVGLFTRLFSRPESFLIGTFAGLILVGTLLLSLPPAHARGAVHPLDAFFTSTSAVCVTGLIVVDTAKDYTLFGQTVILVLIQFGGLGIMTFAALVLQLAGQKLSFRSQAALHDVFYQRGAALQLQKNLRWIVLSTLVIEAIGAALLLASMRDGSAPARPAYTAVFHAISAFCNAGFSTFSDSLVGMRDNPLFMTTVSVLIILGGIGYTVILEVIRRGWGRLVRRRMPVVWTLNTRVVLATTAILILVGAVSLELLGLSENATGWRARTAASLFQSITARTAGFNTVDIGAVPMASLLALTALMFIGGSPGSCAGGIKTTSLAVWVARLKARLLSREDVTIGGRRIPVEIVRRMGLLLGVSAAFNLTGVFVLSITEMSAIGSTLGLHDILFEQISAFATVGLSTGLTPQLSALGKLWIIISMFVGRLGPLTLALSMLERRSALVRLPEERLMIG